MVPGPRTLFSLAPSSLGRTKYLGLWAHFQNRHIYNHSKGLHNNLSWGVCLTYYGPSISPQLTCNSPPGSTTTSRSTTPRTWPSTTRPRRPWPAPRTASTATSSVSGSSPWRGSERAPTSTQVRENKSSDQNDQ